MSRCLCSPALCHADILYVHVENEDGEGDVRLEPTDTLADVVERAVGKKDIERIAWKDVAGWELRASRDKGAKQVASGTSSEPLLDLPDFPSKSLLIITRRPPPPPAAGSSSSSASGKKEAPPADHNGVGAAVVMPTTVSAATNCSHLPRCSAVLSLSARLSPLPTPNPVSITCATVSRRSASH
jgi:hypothetical protein